MAKVRVYELAKDLGVESKDVLSELKGMGEFVRSASSTVEAPVVRRLKDKLAAAAGPGDADGAAKTADGAAKTAPPAKKASAKKSAPAKKTAPAQPAVPPQAVPPSGTAAAPDTLQPPADGQAAAAAGPAITTPEPATPARTGPTPAPPLRPAARREGGPPVPGSPTPRSGRTTGPRPGNNPFTSTTGMQRSRTPRPGRSAPGVPGMPRPNPAMMPQRPSPSVGRERPGAAPAAGARGRPSTGTRGGPPRGGFPAGGRPGPAGRGGRGSTPGAFGRPGGRPSKGRKSRKQRRQEFDNMQAPAIGGVRVRRGNGELVRLARGASLTDFADRIDADPAALVQALFHLGEMVTATQSVNEETLQLLAAELNYTVQVVSPEDEDRELLESFDLEFGENEGGEEDLAPRPPVVTVMGHVDHGKTRLLDAIRDTNVVAREAGGITQHIGAYQVATEVEGVARPITFIDTPGHEAFTAMRARGAKSTDIAVLVVAADDGVMPQTIEALNHAQAADVPVVVAVNKIDRPEADPQKVRGQLSEYGLVPEEYGGDTMFVDVSARERLGLQELLEAVVLTADAALDLRANPEQDAQGVAIEAHLDRGRGPVATVLVQRGTLRVGESIVVGPAFGRVRAMLDDLGENVEEAPPSRPVQVLGLTAVPGAGDSFLVVHDDRMARQVGERREARERNAQLAQRRGRRTLEDFLSGAEKGEKQELLLILKGDVSGSVEALEDALVDLDVGEEVSLRVIDRGVGAITQSNVMLAAASDAVIIGFNVRPEGKARELADREGVDVRFYSVIYQAIEEVESALRGMLRPVYEEVQLGTAEIREVFRSSRVGNIAGCLVTSGVIRRNAKARLVRDGAVVADNVEITSLKRFKDDATEVRDGFECGLTLGGYNDIKVGDVVETFEVRERART